MDIEFAIEYTKVDEMVSTSGCDYCDDPQGRRFIRYDEWEWVNQSPEKKIRVVKDENSWDSKYDNQEPDIPITGIQNQVHYKVCEKCLIILVEKLYNRVSKYVGNPESWYKKYIKECKHVEKLKDIRVGTPVGYEKVW
jgi:hypothetical protein